MNDFGLIVFEKHEICVRVPARLHVAPKDGGHLIVSPRAEVSSRLTLKPHQILSVEYCVRLASKALLQLGFCDWINVQENGNWALKRRQQNHMHVHVYGRSKTSFAQPFGEALRFPIFDDLAEWKTGNFSKDQIEDLKAKCRALDLDPESQTFDASITLLSPSLDQS